MSTSLYAIRCRTTGEWYSPKPYHKYWHEEFKRAKIYSRIGNAKSALTLKLETAKSYCQAGYWSSDPEEKKVLRKFKDAEIVCVGQSTTYYNI